MTNCELFFRSVKNSKNDKVQSGLICLDLIIKYRGGIASKTKLKLVSKEFLTHIEIYDLVNIGKSLGTELDVFTANFGQLNNIEEPVILLVNSDDNTKIYTILCGSDEEQLILYYPNWGVLRISKEEFLSIWDSKIVIKANNRKPSFVKQDVEDKHISMIKDLFLKDLIKIVFSLILLSIIIISIFFYIDKLFSDGYDNYLLYLNLFGLSLFSILSWFLVRFFKDGFQENLQKKLSNLIFHYLSKYNTFRDDFANYINPKNILYDFMYVSNNITNLLIYMVVYIILLIIFILFFLYNIPLVGYLSIAWSIFLFVYNKNLYKRIKNEVRYNSSENMKSDDSIIEYLNFLNSNQDVKAIPFIRERILKNIKEKFDSDKFKINGEWVFIGSVVSLIIMVIVSWELFPKRIDSSHPFSILFLICVIIFSYTIFSIHNIFKSILNQNESIYNFLEEYLFETTNNHIESSYELNQSNPNFYLRGCTIKSTTYPNIINEINLDLTKGRSFIIFGNQININIVKQMFQNKTKRLKGELLVSGKSIQSGNLGILQDFSYFVSPDHSFLDSTVLDNICLVNSPSEINIIIKKLQNLGVESMFKEFPNGLFTKCGLNGKNLSVKQKIIVSIARALISNYKIILFDDSIYCIECQTRNSILNFFINYCDQNNINILFLTTQEELNVKVSSFYVIKRMKNNVYSFQELKSSN